MVPGFVLGEERSSTYPGGYASGRFSPAASLDDHFEQPVSILLAMKGACSTVALESDSATCEGYGDAVPEEESKPGNVTSTWVKLSVALIWFVTWAVGGGCRWGAE